MWTEHLVTLIILHQLNQPLENFNKIPVNTRHCSILRFLGFGHYLREWKGFPVLLSPWEQFCGIEVTFLWDCMKWNTILQKSNLFQFSFPYFYKKVAPTRSEVRRSTRWAIEALLKTLRIFKTLYVKMQYSAWRVAATMCAKHFWRNILKFMNC